MADAAELVARARLICGERHLLSDAAALSTYRSDGRRRAPGSPLPLAVALPGSAVEVSGLVRACAQLEVPYTVRGAGTSGDGGALPAAGALLICLARMRRIIELALDDDELTTEPGVPVASAARAVAPTHGIGLSTPGTVGGAIAAGMPGAVGGLLAAAAGITADPLIGLELVASTGELVRLRPGQPGYDVAGAFTGSHGRCGIAVALTLRLEPRR